MHVTDFAWTNRHVPACHTQAFRPGAKPAKPIVYDPHIQTAPPAGAFTVMVTAALTEAVGPAEHRRFTCGVSVDEDENKPGWQDAMKAALVKECLARWEA